LIGYSLGGGIAASFTSYFPDLVSSLILIAPAGLIRPEVVSLKSKVLYSKGIVPDPLLMSLLRKRLHGSVKYPQLRTKPSDEIIDDPTGFVEVEAPEIDSESESESESETALSQNHSELDMAKIVQFQVDYHQGFAPAYMSTMRNGPIMTEHQTWRRIGKRLTEQNAARQQPASMSSLHHGKVLIICGEKDESIVSDELEQDATAVLEGNVLFRHFDAGHDLPITKSKEVSRAIWDFWSR
jgi:pimeloyl-ACP methyl ester carboxylesterase